MGYGFALLPTAEEPTSTVTFRLTPTEKEERDEWMRGALKRGLTIPEIASEVGLSVGRVTQILNPPKKTKVKSRQFRCPRDVALHEFWNERAHPKCAKGDPCIHCFGMSMIIESEYDENGWPYSWAMYGQEDYIAQCKGAT